MSTLSEKKVRLIWILSILLVILLLLARLLATVDKTTKPVLSNLKQDDVERIVVQITGNDTLEFTKTAGGWYLVKPLNRKADTSRIQVLLATLSLPTDAVYSEAEIDPVEAGLEPARGSLTLNNERFLFGDSDGNGNRRYVQNGEKITLISDIVFPLFALGVQGFVDKRMVPPGFTGLQTAGYSIDKSSGKWLSTDMPSHEAELKIATWLEQSALDILPWPLANDSELARLVAHKVTITLAENSAVVMEFFKLPELVVIHSENSDYGMIITAEQFKALGIGED